MAEEQVPQMRRRNIPSSGEPLPVVGLGTYQVFDVPGSAASLEALEPVLRSLVDHGGSLVDSSPMYGNAETITGDLVTRTGLRQRLFLATKVWTSGREAGMRQIRESFERMRTPQLDLLQVHNLLDWRTHLKTMQALREEGKVRYLGITHYHAGAYGEIERVLQASSWDFVQLNYSLAEREAQERVLPLAERLGVAVIVNRPFAQGSLFARTRGKPLPGWARDIDCETWAQFFLKWIVSHPAVTSVIPATNNLRHMQDNARAGAGRMPDAAQREEMARHFDAL